jgi:hypothetical protein
MLNHIAEFPRRSTPNRSTYLLPLLIRAPLTQFDILSLELPSLLRRFSHDGVGRAEIHGELKTGQ